MKDEKIREVLNMYRKYFEDHKIPQIDSSHEFIIKSEGEPAKVLAHCHGMLNRMEAFLKEGRHDKVFRWLGFIQGCFWTCGVYTLDELMNHNRP